MFTDAWRKGFWQLWGHESWKRIHASESLDFESFHASESLDFESFHAQLWEFRFWALPCFWEFRAFSFERFRSFENWGKFQMETGMCAFTTGADYTLLNVAQTLGHIRDIHDTHTHIYTYIYMLRWCHDWPRSAISLRTTGPGNEMQGAPNSIKFRNKWKCSRNFHLNLRNSNYQCSMLLSRLEHTLPMEQPPLHKRGFFPTLGVRHPWKTELWCEESRV